MIVSNRSSHDEYTSAFHCRWQCVCVHYNWLLNYVSASIWQRAAHRVSLGWLSECAFLRVRVCNASSSFRYGLFVNEFFWTAPARNGSMSCIRVRFPQIEFSLSSTFFPFSNPYRLCFSFYCWLSFPIALEHFIMYTRNLHSLIEEILAYVCVSAEGREQNDDALELPAYF